METLEIFKLLSDYNRLSILILLLNKELCICDIESVLNMKQANVSKHMKRFKELGVVNYRKDAQWVYYSLNETFRQDHNLLIDYIKRKGLEDQNLNQLVEQVLNNSSCSIKNKED